MRLFSTAPAQFGLLLLVVAVAIAWSVAVPARLTPSSFIAFAALLAGCAWVTATSYMNARPANSLAQSLHDADAAEANRVRKIR